MKLELKGRDIMSRITLTVDMRQLSRATLGALQWRKWLGVLLIRCGTGVLRCNVDFLAEETP